MPCLLNNVETQFSERSKMGSFNDTRPISRSASRSSSASPLSTSNSQIEILYSLPDARIVEFKPSALNFKSVARTESAVIEAEPGTLSWVSRFERTIAVGSLHIYRAPGSVAFINCQNSIRPILPKSQAWCVDGESKFVLRSPPLFWRIELPNTSYDEVVRVEGLKRILDQILRFEKTPCPFRRNFSIQLTTPPPTPVKKKSWKAFNQSEVTEKKDLESSKSLKRYDVNFNSLIVPNQKVNSPSKSNINLDICSKSSERNAGSKKSRHKTFMNSSQNISNLPSGQSLRCSDIVESTHDPVIETQSHSTLKKITGRTEDKPLLREKQTDKHGRCITLQQIQRPSTPPSRQSLKNENVSEHWDLSSKNDSIAQIEGDRSGASSSASFYSLKSRHSPIKTPSTGSKASISSEISIYSLPHYSLFLSPTGKNNQVDNTYNTSSKSSNPPENSLFGQELDKKMSLASNISKTSSDRSEESESRILKELTPETPKDQREVSQNRKSFDENFYAKNSSISPAISSKVLHLAHHLPTTIIQKTFEILFKPSSHLLQLMLGIASRIALGEWHGVLANYGEPIHWDFEEEYGDIDDYNDRGWFEDDFGNPFFSVNLISDNPSRSWEVD
ncbi:hypothetical protein GcM1_237102 [Golovinomyces cichoracearum]|uniref:Inheritance of peroxisomes protein 1 n=1 Tax=Golovinomyces cichoracearum TaxID=62708 RepID=A0A420IK41_9PEZI|nr:hypothetical protein GcM1_237102 [Golovinomyces cichoracearum]